MILIMTHIRVILGGQLLRKFPHYINHNHSTLIDEFIESYLILPPFTKSRNTSTSALAMVFFQAKKLQKFYVLTLWFMGNNFSIMLESSAVTLSTTNGVLK